MSSSHSTWLAVSVALVLGACAGPRTEVIARASPVADFQAFKTYAFAPITSLDLTGSQMSDPVTRQNLETAIGRELQGSGLLPASGDARPSLLVSYFADVYEGPVEASDKRDNWERQGRLTVDLVDASNFQVVWHGEAWARDPNLKVADQLVVDLLRKYPQAGKAPQK
jgi:hypothetical protein